jgi:hypothetical protein
MARCVCSTHSAFKAGISLLQTAESCLGTLIVPKTPQQIHGLVTAPKEEIDESMIDLG